MATRLISYSDLINDRTPSSGYMVIGMSSNGVNRYAQLTFPAITVRGKITSVRFVYSWDNAAAGEGFKASAVHKLIIGGATQTYNISGGSESSSVELPVGWSIMDEFVVDLRSHSTADSTSKGYSKNAYLLVTYTPVEPTNMPFGGTAATVQGGINKKLISGKVAMKQGVINKSLVTGKIAPVKGEINKSISLGGLRGDINGDGVIDISDYTLIRLYLQGLAQLSAAELLRADIDQNGKVDETDAMIIRAVIQEL